MEDYVHGGKVDEGREGGGGAHLLFINPQCAVQPKLVVV